VRRGGERRQRAKARCRVEQAQEGHPVPGCYTLSATMQLPADSKIGIETLFSQRNRLTGRHQQSISPNLARISERGKKQSCRASRDLQLSFNAQDLVWLRLRATKLETGKGWVETSLQRRCFKTSGFGLDDQI
jgi:hypothetical protein